VAAARNASDTDILVLAVRDDQMLPPHIRSWLLLCVGLRDEDQEGALVVLIDKEAETADSNSLLLAYLERVATMGRLAFFPRQQRASTRNRTMPALLLDRGPDGPCSDRVGCNRTLAIGQA